MQSADVVLYVRPITSYHSVENATKIKIVLQANDHHFVIFLWSLHRSPFTILVFEIMVNSDNQTKRASNV